MNSKRAVKKGEEGENKVITLLETDNHYHRLINNLVLLGQNNISHQIDHILVRKNGIFVIETKNYYGEIKGKEDDSYWTRSYFVKGRIKTVKFNNPIKQNQSHIRNIVRLIGKNYPIYCFVVFTQNNADDIDLFNVCNLNSLLNRINMIVDNVSISKSEIDKIAETLLINEADVNNEQHIEKVKEATANRKEHQKKMREAIEKRICPYCGGQLALTANGLKCIKCTNILKI